MNKIDIQKIREYRENGFTIVTIAKKLRTTVNVIEYLSKINNIKSVSKKGRKRCIVCGRFADRKEMYSSSRGLRCKECWEKR